MHWPQRTRAHFILAVSLSCAAASACATDLSRLSDFATGSILQNAAWIDQIGDRNFASIEQGPAFAGTVDRQYADITQVGTGNQAKVLQIGDLNRVRIVQDGGDFGVTATNGIVDIKQTGTGNSVDLLQMGDGNKFVAAQSGNGNSINLNGRTQDQGGAILQLGQRGTNNRISLHQENDNNKFSALQDGNDNVIEFTQNGSNEARVIEYGNGNTVIHEQHDGDPIKVDVTLHGGESWGNGGLTVRVTVN